MYLGQVLDSHFSVWTEWNAVKFQMLHSVAYVSGNWSIIFMFSFNEKVASAELVLQDGGQRKSHPRQPYFRD
jgi:hypothetical protein